MGPGHSKRPFHGPAPPTAQDAAFVPQLARLAAPAAAVVAAVVAVAVADAAGPKNQRQHVKAPLHRRRTPIPWARPPIAQDAAFVPKSARLAAPAAAAAVIIAAAAAVIAAAAAAAVIAVIAAAAAAAAGPKNQRQHVKAPLHRRRPIFHTSFNTSFDATDSVVEHSEVKLIHYIWVLLAVWTVQVGAAIPVSLWCVAV